MTDRTLSPQMAASLGRLLDVSSRLGPRALMLGLDAEIARVLGRSYITVSLREKDNLTRRIFSSAPAVYPEGALKDLIRNDRTRRLLDEGIAYLANSPEDLQRQYVDPDVLAKSGVTSLANLPIRLFGTVRGVLNIADTGPPRDADFLPDAQLYADFLAPLLMMAHTIPELFAAG